MKIKKLWLKLENSWIFWLILIGGFITLISAGMVHAGLILFPVGLLMLFKLDFFIDYTFIIYIWAIIYWIGIIYLVRKIVMDKKLNTRLVLILLGILALTFIGCTTAGGRI